MSSLRSVPIIASILPYHWVVVIFGFFKIGQDDSLYITGRDITLLCSLQTLRLVTVLFRVLLRLLVTSYSYRWYWWTRLSGHWQTFLLLITYLISELGLTEMPVAGLLIHGWLEPLDVSLCNVINTSMKRNSLPFSTQGCSGCISVQFMVASPLLHHHSDLLIYPIPLSDSATGVRIPESHVNTPSRRSYNNHLSWIFSVIIWRRDQAQKPITLVPTNIHKCSHLRYSAAVAIKSSKYCRKISEFICKA